MSFEFATAARIVFGQGSVKELGSAVRTLGQSALLIVGRTLDRAGAVVDDLRSSGVTVVPFHAASEPTLQLVQSGLEAARSAQCEVIIAMGGGSVIDSGKAIAALVSNPGPILNYLEVVGDGRPLERAGLPFIAVPTTAGTGSEVTRNAVLAVPEKGAKVSLRHPSMLPRLAIVDPELTYGLPPRVTASSGMDALSQLIEPFLSNSPNPMIDAWCRDGLRRAARSLRSAYRDGSNASAREDMALAAMFSGMALANGRLGAVHGFAGPIGGMFAAPHGAVCAQLLPSVLRENVSALRQDTTMPGALARFREVARLLTDNAGAVEDDAARWVEQLCAELEIPPLRSYGMKAADFPEIVSRASRASSMRGNPIPLSDSQLTRILERAL
jgi:alcohol dehydrogenase class IV